DNALYRQQPGDKDIRDEEEKLDATFDLGLTEKQRRDREGVVLPYFDAQKDGGGVGGDEYGSMTKDLIRSGEEEEGLQPFSKSYCAGQSFSFGQPGSYHSRVTTEAVIAPPQTVISADSEYQQRRTLPARALEVSKNNSPIATAEADPVSSALHSEATSKILDASQLSEPSQTARQPGDMAEPPAKRAKRTDSSAMWDRNERPSKPPTDREMKDAVGGRDRREDRDRDRDRAHVRDDRRYRSRSRDRAEKRRERSRSREHEGGRRYRNGDKGHDGTDRRDRRDHERTTSRDRHRPRRDDPPPRSDRHRTRSRSPARNGTSARIPSSPPKPRIEASRKSHSPPPKHTSTGPSQPSSKPPAGPKASTTIAAGPDKMQIDTLNTTNGTKSKEAKEVEDEDPELAMMRKMMGFAGFRSTKNTKVPGNNVYAVRKEKKTEYRQYMNRVGGFNRPLSPSR
ncbi:hypothetical protein MMC08_002428, partial [Hypocenomyce scalaris]|nr:hypothetical protein [Hypocenomyce scalaris]